MSENYVPAGEGEQLASRLGSAVKRRKLLILLCILGAMGPVTLLNQISAPVYEASTILVFEEAQSSIPFALDLASQGNDLFDHLEEIQSLSFAEEVARSLPQHLRERLEATETQVTGSDSLAAVAMTISRSIAAEPVRKSNLVRIRIRMGDPELCMAVANTAAEVLQGRNLRVKQQGVHGVRTFVENQVERFAKNLEQSEQALRRFKQANGITAFDVESQEVLRRMTEAEILHNAARTNREAAEQRLSAVESTVDEQKRRLAPSVTAINAPSVQRLKEKLFGLELQYTDFTVQNYPVDHPKLIELRQEIEETKKTLSAEAIKLAQGNNVVDPITQIEKFVNESLSLQIEIESVRAQEAGLSKIIDGYEQQLRELPAMEYELARITREREVNQKIYVTLLEKLEQSKISEAEQLPSIRVIDLARLPEKPVAPRKGLNLALAFAVGLVLGLGLALVLEVVRGSLDMTQDLEKVTGWPVLSWVPRATFGRRGRRIAQPGSAAAEAYELIKTQVEQLGVGSRHRSLMVTSLGPGDGKSTTIANLAVAFATSGVRTLLVDAELRRPTLHTVFDIPVAPGLSEFMTANNGGQARLSAVKPQPAYAAATQSGGSGGIGSRLEARPFTSTAAIGTPPTAARATTLEHVAFRRGIVPNLTILTCGARIRQDKEILTGPQVRALLDRLAADYEVVLVDAAPLLLVHTATVVAKQVDAVLLVVDATAYDPDMIRRIKNLLDRAEANVIGTVVNKMDLSGVYKSAYYQYYQSH
jgi:polysaccharide biosynthesis transport protein